MAPRARQRCAFFLPALLQAADRPRSPRLQHRAFCHGAGAPAPLLDDHAVRLPPAPAEEPPPSAAPAASGAAGEQQPDGRLAHGRVAADDTARVVVAMAVG